MDKMKLMLQQLFENQKLRTKQAIQFHESLAGNLSEEEREKLSVDSPFNDRLENVIESDDTKILDVLHHEHKLIEEYLLLIKAFNANELKAFILGLGLKIEPFEYWGIDELKNFNSKIEKAIEFNQNNYSEDHINSQRFIKPDFLELLNSNNLVTTNYRETCQLEMLKEILNFTEATIEILDSAT